MTQPSRDYLRWPGQTPVRRFPVRAVRRALFRPAQVLPLETAALVPVQMMDGSGQLLAVESDALATLWWALVHGRQPAMRSRQMRAGVAAFGCLR